MPSTIDKLDKLFSIYIYNLDLEVSEKSVNVCKRKTPKTRR